jgi:DNA-binding beta-propeller fold protein YncE
MRARSRSAAAGLALAAALLAAPGAHAQEPATGNAALYIGTYDKSILELDEATMEIRGRIPLRTGIPGDLVLNDARTRFYVVDVSYENVEVVDIASKRTLDTFTLSQGNDKVRIWGFNVEPRERYAVLLAKRYRKLRDRYEVSGPMLLRYDLREHRVTDTIAWPKGEEREFARILFSPDGELLYFFADDILVLETQNFTEVDRWEYAQALDVGMGRFDFGFPDQTYEQPGFFTGLFRVTDPVQNRRIMGVARVNLSDRQVQFFTLGPDDRVSFALAPGGRRAYGLHQEVGNYQFWTFDLDRRRVVSRAVFRGRPRMSLQASSSGQVLYVYNAGNTIDLYDASDYRFLRTVDLNADNTTPLIVVPRSPAAPAEEPPGAR